MNSNHVRFRRYCTVSDFQEVYDLCARCGDVHSSNGMSASFWESAQTFGSFNYECSHRIGLWETTEDSLPLRHMRYPLERLIFAAFSITCSCQRS